LFVAHDKTFLQGKRQRKKDENRITCVSLIQKTAVAKKTAASKGAPEQQQFHFWFAVTVTERVTAAVSGTAATQKKQHHENSLCLWRQTSFFLSVQRV
jgi:hypothetical protein